MLVAGLTGSIATGKSTVSVILRDLGAFIVDADQAAREVVLPGMPAWEKIVEIFGRDILQPTGEIDRERLGHLVFNDAKMRAVLEEVVHPEVVRVMNEYVRTIGSDSPDAVVILDVPLLIETGMHKGLSEVIVVYCPEDQQIRRLMMRDSINREEALARIRAQISIEEKKRHASMIIDNSFSREETQTQAEKAFVALREKAGKDMP
ncbi:MAG TPA: dephospho-CoA kinase [Deltaproteobacteria bacterium]|nr:dephospho-CoA kinase [Deltaproteobacteria bacterium]HPR54783.1 dephospho-CoA kinase [Deltaproteobacteria bacterium]